MNPRTIRITGEARKAFAPDLINVSLDHSKLFATYEEALNEVAAKTKILRQKVIEAGLDGETLKTTDFAVEPAYESYKDANGNYRKRFIGYENKASFEICFPLDNAVLSSLLGKLQDSQDKMDFSYRLSNPEEAQEEVMALATKAAIRKASIIASSASVSLGEIQSIDYSVEEIRVQYQRYALKECYSADCTGSPEVDITPRDLTFEDSVTIVFAIA